MSACCIWRESRAICKTSTTNTLAALLHRVADDSARVYVQHHSHISPALSRPAADSAFPLPAHGDYLEGLASGPAIVASWGVKPGHLAKGYPAWDVQARYLAPTCNHWSTRFSLSSSSWGLASFSNHTAMPRSDESSLRPERHTRGGHAGAISDVLISSSLKNRMRPS